MGNDPDPAVRAVLAHLQEDARTVPLRVRDEDRGAALECVRALLFERANREAHYALAEQMLPNLPRKGVRFDDARADEIVAAGPDSLTNEELALILLVHRPMNQVSYLIATRAPAWSDAEFMALGERLAAERGWTAPAGW